LSPDPVGVRLSLPGPKSEAPGLAGRAIADRAVGNGGGQSRHLPRTGWTWLATIEEGGWRGVEAVPVDIAASFGFDGRGVWYLIERGIRGLLVPDEHGKAVCYMICESASHYYLNMTGSRRMPVLIGDGI
jgi:hypothetical protein